MKSTFLTLFFWFTRICYGQEQLISIAEFNEIKSLSSVIERLCPPNECIVIGVGRSPTPITSYLRLVHQDLPDYVYEVPLTSFKYGALYGKNLRKPLLDKSFHPKLKKHFDHFLPSIKDLNDIRQFLVIDFGVSGESLAAASYYIERYFKKIYPEQVQVMVKRALFTYIPVIFYDKFKFDAIISLDPYPEISKKMCLQNYDMYARFKPFLIEKTDVRQDFTNPHHQKFLEELKIHVSNSP